MTHRPAPRERTGAVARRRLPTLTGMRFVAAFLVFTSHCCSLGYFGPAVPNWLGRYALASGYAGVEFFFLLSGFVLTWSAPERDRASAFWRRRFARIYPNHLLTWVLALLLALVAGERVTASQAVPSLLLVHTWLPSLTVSASLNLPSWTLSCELLFYLLFPLLHAGIRRVPPRLLWWCVAGIVLVLIVLPVVVHQFVPGRPALPGEDLSVPQKWLLVSFPPTRLLEFVLGILLARIVRTGRWVRVPLPLAALLVAAAFAEDLVLAPTAFGVTLPLAAPLLLLIGAGATADLRGGRTGLSSRVAVRLGELSYACYLLHYLVLSGVRELLGPASARPVPGTLALLAGLFLVVLLLSWALYTGVERPCQRRWSGRAVPPRAPVPGRR